MGEIVGVDDVKSERHAVEVALELIDPVPKVTFQAVVHELKDVIIVEIEPIEFPDLATAKDGDGDPTVYFRIGPQTRPADRATEKSINRLRRFSRGERRVDASGQIMLDWLWAKSEATEAICARRLNYSSHRIRKLLESLIGGGYVVPCNIGKGRSYAAIHPGPGRTQRI